MELAARQRLASTALRESLADGRAQPLEIRLVKTGIAHRHQLELGPVGLPKMSVAFGFGVLGPLTPTRLTTNGAAIATMISTMMKIADAIATRSERNRRQNSCSGERAVISPLTSSTLSSEGPPSLSTRSSDAPKLISWRYFRAAPGIPPPQCGNTTRPCGCHPWLTRRQRSARLRIPSVGPPS